jgi:hypothetical protein
MLTWCACSLSLCVLIQFSVSLHFEGRDKFNNVCRLSYSKTKSSEKRVRLKFTHTFDTHRHKHTHAHLLEAREGAEGGDDGGLAVGPQLGRNRGQESIPGTHPNQWG